jgi:DNA-directed RNA polymerase subunit K/omega
MKYIDLERIWDKYPNKYRAIVIASKEARKIIEAQKPPAIPEEAEDTQTATASGTAVRAPETAETTAETNVPKRRGRKPKKSTETKEKQEEVAAEAEPLKEPLTPEYSMMQKGHSVVAEKTEQNPYLAAIKKILVE